MQIAVTEAVSHTGVGLCTLDDGRLAVSVYGADRSQVYQGPAYIHERLSPLPRAYVIYAAEHIPDSAQARDLLLDGSFELRNVAVTADPVELPAGPG